MGNRIYVDTEPTIGDDFKITVAIETKGGEVSANDEDCNLIDVAPIYFIAEDPNS
jgi:hypothetical protein